MLALNGEGAGKRKSGELPLAADGEEFWAQTQAMAERSMPACGRQVCATGW